MTKTTNNYFRKLTMLVAAMAAGLVLASGTALAVSKVCLSGSTQANPCSGTKNIDTLIGTSGIDYIMGLAANDNISGGAGNDTYSYKDGWGTDTLIDASGVDALNFSAVGSAGGGIQAQLSFDAADATSKNVVLGPFAGLERVNFSSGTVIEKVTGSVGDDFILTGRAANTLQPGPGTSGAHFKDFGGCPSSYCAQGGLPVSSDTYSGFAASGYGAVDIEDWGGTTDKLVLPFASTDVYFEARNDDADVAADTLIMLTSTTDTVIIRGQLEPDTNTDTGTAVEQKGRIEQIQFTDGIVSIGSEISEAQTLSAASAKTADSAEAQVEKLNEASSLDASEKEKRKKAAKKVVEEEKKKDKESKAPKAQKAQDSDKDQQQSPSSSGEEQQR